MNLVRRIIFPVILLASEWCSAQSDNQIWFEGMVNYPFANVYNLESAFTAASAPSYRPRWVSLDFQETLERSLTQHIDLMAAGLFSSTLQNDSLSTREIRGTVGGRFHFTPNSRVLVRLLARYESRHMLNTESDTWSSSSRTRFRLETVVPFNKPSMFAGDDLWYGLFDGEVFTVLDQNLKERFANRFRIRAGVGYRMSYTWRFELMYTLQESQNEIGSGFETIDHIFRARVKIFLNPSKPSVANGTGN